MAGLNPAHEMFQFFRSLSLKSFKNTTHSLEKYTVHKHYCTPVIFEL